MEPSPFLKIETKKTWESSPWNCGPGMSHRGIGPSVGCKKQAVFTGLPSISPWSLLVDSANPVIGSALHKTWPGRLSTAPLLEIRLLPAAMESNSTCFPYCYPLCPWPEVTYCFTKQPFFPGQPHQVLFHSPGQSTSWGVHHQHRSVYQGWDCSWAHQNPCRHFEIFSPCPPLSHAQVCTLTLGWKSQKSLRPLPEKSSSPWNKKHFQTWLSCFVLF